MERVPMRSRTVAFAADPVTERTAPFAFVEHFTRCDDFRRGCASVPKGGRIAKCLIRCAGRGDRILGRLVLGASRDGDHSHQGWEY